jgi:predicted transcriptional regulator
MAKPRLPVAISEHTKQQLDRYAKAHGLKRSHLVEQALLHHLQAEHEFPADIEIPPHLISRLRRSKS